MTACLFQAITDGHLLGVVAGIVGVDVIFFLFWGLFDPYYVAEIEFEEQVSGNRNLL